MILFPAIDIKNGECVRLRLGEMRDSKIYNSSPLSQAIKFQEMGFDWVHIVDLDAAVNGKSKNKPIIEEIINNNYQLNNQNILVNLLAKRISR